MIKKKILHRSLEKIVYYDTLFVKCYSSMLNIDKRAADIAVVPNRGFLFNKISI